MRNPFLIGEKIYLRGLNEKDLEGNYINWLNDPEVCKYNSHHVFPYYMENGENYIKSTYNSKNSLVLAIVIRETNIHIGNISLQKIDYISRNAEFAILIGEKNFWGKGYSKEASTLIITHGFLSLNLHRIYCGTSSDNIAMQKLAIYLGMFEEGRRKEAIYKNGKYSDIIEYGLLRNKFLEDLNKKVVKE